MIKTILLNQSGEGVSVFTMVGTVSGGEMAVSDYPLSKIDFSTFFTINVKTSQKLRNLRGWSITTILIGKYRSLLYSNSFL